MKRRLPEAFGRKARDQNPGRTFSLALLFGRWVCTPILRTLRNRLAWAPSSRPGLDGRVEVHVDRLDINHSMRGEAFDSESPCIVTVSIILWAVRPSNSDALALFHKLDKTHLPGHLLPPAFWQFHWIWTGEHLHYLQPVIKVHSA